MPFNFKPITSKQLHLPHKDWASNPQDAQNWYELERWSMRLGTVGVARAVYINNSISVPSGTTVFVPFNTSTQIQVIGSAFTPVSDGVLVTQTGFLLYNGFVTWGVHGGVLATAELDVTDLISIDEQSIVDVTNLDNLQVNFGGGSYTDSPTNKFQISYHQASGATMTCKVYVSLVLIVI